MKPAKFIGIVDDLAEYEIDESNEEVNGKVYKSEKIVRREENQ